MLHPSYWQPKEPYRKPQSYVISNGQRFARLTVTGTTRGTDNRIKYVCRCDCGKTTLAKTNQLISGSKKSCGCIKKENLIGDLVAGTKYGRLTVESFLHVDTHHQRVYLFRCDCGKETELSCYKVLSGHTSSCGCLYDDTRGKSLLGWDKEKKAERKTSIDLGLAILSATLQPGQIRTREEIAAYCDCDPESIRAIEKGALEKLASHPATAELREYLAILDDGSRETTSNKKWYG